MGQVISAFANFDVNGDGVIDFGELFIVLQELNPVFFTKETIKILMDEADADGDEEVHYGEFFAWLFDEDPIVVHRVLATASLYH